MKATELINHLHILVGEYGDLDTIYAKDDEGNGFYLVHNDPTPCIFLSEDEVDFESHTNLTHICIN